MRKLCSWLAATSLLVGLAWAAPAPYPLPLPRSDGQIYRFLYGVVSRKETLDFNSAFSPDGRLFYFTRSVNGQWDILVAHPLGGNHGWDVQGRAPFSEDKFSEADPAFAADGKLYFISNRPKTGGDKPSDFDIWYVEPQPDGSWSAPKNATELNSERDEYYISFSKAGDAYLGSDRPGGFGDMDLYMSRHVDGRFLPPENLGPGINTKESEHDACLISADETLLVFKSENRPDGLGEADLYVSRRDADGRWQPAVNLGAPVNTPAYEYCSYLTPDGRYFFFSSELDIKWMDADALRRRAGELTGGTKATPP
jgi:hypothetical protein